MSVDSAWTKEAALSAFDDHLRRVRGVCAGTRANYARWVGVFFEERFPDGRVQVEDLGVQDVVAFISGASRRYQPKTLELVATSLRSFFRLLRSPGLGANGLEDAVAMVAHRQSGLVRHLGSPAFGSLIASLEGESTRDLRDRAIILCMARIRLRVSEVCRLSLDDIDWRQAVVWVRTRKTGHGARLPIPAEVGDALARTLGQRGPPRGDRRSARAQRARHHSDLRSSRRRRPP